MTPGRDAAPGNPGLRRLGAVIALSTPITAFLSYAVVAIVVGEEHLEGDGGLTVVGWLAIAAPLVGGLALIAWSRQTTRSPSRRVVGLTVTALAAACLLLGWRSVTDGADAGDASIGGGLLILAATPLVPLGLAIAFWPRSRASLER